MINYNAASKSYDNTRGASEELITHFNNVVHFSHSTTVLDFGCGTGSYLNLIQTVYGCKCHGVEPSQGMRVKAKEKNRELRIEAGDHSRIPCADDFFDFVYMTDVIHHVPDLGHMFRTIRRVLKPQGKLCIVTESHAQIEGRFYNRYFPSLANNEKRRYPDVQDIVRHAEGVGFRLSSVEIRPAPASAAVSASLVRTAEEKNFSMFRLLGDEEHASGLERLKTDLGKIYETEDAGDSLIWLENIEIG
jgi:SAM-dependent methyltransferase